MEHLVKFLRIIGGQDDGLVTTLSDPWEVDPSEVLDITCDGERFKLSHIDGHTAVFKHDGFVPPKISA